MDHPAENDASRIRLSQLLASVTDADLAQTLDDGWTAGAALMHVAFWDRQMAMKLQDWAERGVATVVPGERGDVHLVNEQLIKWWRGFTPNRVRSEAIAAAEAIDGVIAGLPESVMDSLRAEQAKVSYSVERLTNRAIHRNEHIDEIERALGR